MICPKCKIDKSEKCFDIKTNSYNGRNKWCIPCKREYEERYRQDNAEKIKKSRLARKEQYNTARREAYWKNIQENRGKIKERYRINTQSRLLSAAKRRAKEKGLQFNIEIEDIEVPKFCPVLGIELCVGNGSAQDNSPSLDRIIPGKGYVKGNVIVVSHKANTIKNNATVEELEMVLKFYKDLIMKEDLL